MAERAVTVPRVGTITARADVPGAGVDEPVRQRRHRADLRLGVRPLVRLAVGYQDAAEEAEIVAVRTGRAGPGPTGTVGSSPTPWPSPGPRATHPELRRGSSVRGAIDLTAIALELDRLGSYPDHERIVLDAALLALSARIGVDEASDATPEAVITEIWENHFFSVPGARRRESIG